MSLSSFIRTGKNASMLLAGSMTRMVAGFVFVIYCADKLGLEGFGKYSIAIHYFELFLSLSSTAVGILLTRDMSRWPRHTNQLVTSSIVLVSVASILSIVVMSSLSTLFSYSDDTHQLLLIAGITLIPASICAVFEAAFVARERAEFFTSGIAIESLIRIAASVWLLYNDFGLIWLLWIFLVVRCGLLTAYLIALKRMGGFQWKFHSKRTRRFFSRWRVFAAENWMATIYTNLDVIFLSWISGEAVTGIYSAAGKIVRLGSVVAKSYTTAVFPVMSRLYLESKDAFKKLYSHTIRIMFATALPAITAVMFIPDRIVNLFFSSEYTEAAPVLQVLIWVLLLEFLNPFLSHCLFAQGRQHRSMRVAAISLVVNTIATYLLVTWFAAVGAAAGTIIGGGVATCCYLFFAMSKREVILTFMLGIRVAIAALIMGIVVWTMRDVSWIVLLPSCLAIYVPMLFLVGAVRMTDIRFFQTLFLTRASS